MNTSMPPFRRILTTTALCIAAAGLNSCSALAAPDKTVIELTEAQPTREEPTVDGKTEIVYEWGVIRSLCPEVSALNGKPWSEVRRRLAQQGITELATDSVEYGVLARCYARYKAKDASIQYIFASRKNSNILYALRIKSGKLIGHHQGVITAYERSDVE